MALPVRDSFVDLERHRQRLEENVSRLRKALKHWQTWEAEYEGLKEEIVAFHGNPQLEDLIAIGRDFGGTVVNEKEIKELLGDGQKVRRNATQVVNVISRRIEYVQKNAKTVEKHLHTAEDKLNSILVISKPDIRNEEGLPIMEIREELDEEGNVISSSATTPSDSTPQVIDALHKAGITDLGTIRHTETAKPRQIETTTSEPSQLDGQMKPHVAEDMRLDPENPKPPPPNSMGTVSPNPKPSPRKKEVEQQRPPDYKNASKQPAVPKRGGDSGRITENTEDAEEHSSLEVPIDESPKDAALRKEMLKYTFSEVGAIVAELDLDEDDSQCSYSDDYDEGGDEEDQETSSVEEEEDKFGRTTRRVVDDKYRKEMEALERKLNAKMMEKAGPRPSEPPLGDIADNLGQLSVAHNASAKTASDELKKPLKKGVRFAEELDISPAPQNAATGAAPETRNLQPPLEESVIERGSTTGGRTELEPSKPRKFSKFKSSHVPVASTPKQPFNSSSTLEGSVSGGGPLANGSSREGIIERSLPGVAPSLPLFPAAATKNSHQVSSPIILHSEPRIAPEGPPGKILSDGVIERFAPDRNAEPPDPDGIDPALLRQEVAMEYHRIRNRMIQREGGFMPQEEELEQVPLTEEEGGSGKKVSRFKVARVGKRVGP